MNQSITPGQHKQIRRFLEDGVNLEELDQDSAQRLVERGDKLQQRMKEIVIEISGNRYKHEERRTGYVFLREDYTCRYPKAYTGPKPIIEQIDILAKALPVSLSLAETWYFLQNELPKLKLPKGAEGWFAIPRLSKLAQFPLAFDAVNVQYTQATKRALDLLAAARPFKDSYGMLNENKEESSAYIYPNAVIQSQHSHRMISSIARKQKGDILIIPAQFGLLHKGRSMRRAREVFMPSEFGLGLYATICMLITHPERLVDDGNEQLKIGCVGDECVPRYTKNSQNSFEVPFLSCGDHSKSQTVYLSSYPDNLDDYKDLLNTDVSKWSAPTAFVL